MNCISLLCFHECCLRKSSDEQDKVSVGTAALLDYLREAYDDTDFFFCLGADAFLDLMAGKWNESARVLARMQEGRRLVVLHRSTSNNSKDDEDNLQLHLSLRLEQSGARLMRIDHLGSISSSQVRECQDLEQLSTMVVPRVLEYMRANQLYQFAE
jgi:nicotinic acid mononucleotide adenylyltransferase